MPPQNINWDILAKSLRDIAQAQNPVQVNTGPNDFAPILRQNSPAFQVNPPDYFSILYQLLGGQQNAGDFRGAAQDLRTPRFTNPPPQMQQMQQGPPIQNTPSGMEGMDIGMIFRKLLGL